jgi:hypothetical protein
LEELLQCFGRFELAASAAGEHETIVEDHENRVIGRAIAKQIAATAF